jgi:hypothetical protein
VSLVALIISVFDQFTSSPMGSASLNPSYKKQTPEDCPPVAGTWVECDDRFIGYANLECTQQNGGDECEHRAYGQHIKPQGNVHGTPPWLRSANLARRKIGPKPQMFCIAADAREKRAVVRSRRSSG